jgi:hypothetical protein
MRNYFLHAADLSVREPDLDAMWVIWRVGKQVFYYAFGKAARSLVLLENDRDSSTWFDVVSNTVRHIRKASILTSAYPRACPEIVAG